MAAMVATMATKKETSAWRPGSLVAVVTPPSPFPRPGRPRRRTAISQKDRKHNPRGHRSRAGAAGSLPEEGRCELAPGVEREAPGIGRQHLYADMIGASRVMRAHPLPDRVDTAPGHDRVHQTIASSVLQVIVGEA